MPPAVPGVRFRRTDRLVPPGDEARRAAGCSGQHPVGADRRPAFAEGRAGRQRAPSLSRAAWQSGRLARDAEVWLEIPGCRPAKHGNRGRRPAGGASRRESSRVGAAASAGAGVAAKGFSGAGANPSRHTPARQLLRPGGGQCAAEPFAGRGEKQPGRPYIGSSGGGFRSGCREGESSRPGNRPSVRSCLAAVFPQRRSYGRMPRGRPSLKGSPKRPPRRNGGRSASSGWTRARKRSPA